MSAPYLNHGESIVMTTHRVSVDAVLFDLMLTNDRLILIDSTYTRFEPRHIPFSSVISVKGGIAPTREPAIVLTLEETGELSTSYLVNLIFSQEPGEDRAYERGQWVRKLIELVIQARERAAQEDTLPPDRRTGVQPSIRRFIAPDQLRPHSSADEPLPPPQPVTVVDSVEPDSLEFFLEGLRPKKTGLPEEARLVPEAITFVEVPGKEPVPARETPVPRQIRSSTPVRSPPTASPATPSLPEPIDTDESTRYPDITPVRSPTAPKPVIPTPPQQTEMDEPISFPDITPVRSPTAPKPLTPTLPEPAEDAVPDTFASTVMAATRALQASAAGHQPAVIPPAMMDTDEQLPAEITESLSNNLPAATVQETSNDPIETEIPPGPEPIPHEETPLPRPSVPGRIRELPGTYTPAIPTAATGTIPSDNNQAARTLDTGIHKEAPRAGRPAMITGALVLVALIVVAGGLLFLSHTLPGYTGDDQAGVITPAITGAPTPALVPVTAEPAGVQVNILYPGTFSGTIGDTEYPRRVTGTGNQSYTVVINKGIVQALVQKLDNSGDALTVEIYNNNTLLSRKTVTAPMGEIHVLIDLATARPPGIAADATVNAGRTGQGNATLVYY
jgi:hypothetical protein